MGSRISDCFTEMITAIALLTVLVACGGGGSNTDIDTSADIQSTDTYKQDATIEDVSDVQDGFIADIGGDQATGDAYGSDGVTDGDASTCTPTGIDSAFAAKLQAALDAWIQGGGAPGVTVAVYLPCEGMWTGASGVANIDTATPIQPGMLVRVASITKTYVAAIILRLVEEGLLGLDDTLGTILTDTQWPNVTIRQLLSHSSGIFEYLDDLECKTLANSDPAHVFTRAELLAYAALHEPYSEPGLGYHYSNTNYILLGLVIEKLRNATFLDVLHTELLDPLDLSHTYMAGDEKVPDVEVMGYLNIGTTEEPDLVTRDINPSVVWTAGAMVSTVEDVTRWIYALYNGEVISASSLEEMMACIPVSENFYGLGTMCYTTPMGMFYGHTGGYFGFTSSAFYMETFKVYLGVSANFLIADLQSLISSLSLAIIEHATSK